jgi:thiol-disulfide isomerase/thioredoxin
MCNHCPYVKAKIDAMVRLAEKWGDTIGFVGINSNEPNYEGEGMKNMKLFVQERNIQFPYVLDETQEVAKAYGAVCTPDPFLFDREQKLVFHGRIDDAFNPGDTPKEHTMEENIEKMLRGEEVAEETKPSMGCSIKWID